MYRSLVSVYRVFERHVHLLLSVLGWVLSSSLYERTCFLYLEDLSRAESDLGSYVPCESLVDTTGDSRLLGEEAIVWGR